MTEEELRQMSANGAIPVSQNQFIPNMNVPQQGYIYYRKCPLCGNMEAVSPPNTTLPNLQSKPIPARNVDFRNPVDSPSQINSPDSIGVFENGKDLEDGGASAEWR